MPEISTVQLANERYTIIQALNQLGVDVLDFSISSLKVYCPFGNIMHEDEGRTKAMRVYPGTNSAYCFACQTYYTPVKLIAMDKGISEYDAAVFILEATNYVAPDYASRWAKLTEESTKLNTDDLVEALKVACARMAADWEDRQFEPDVAKKLSRCLAALRGVKTDADATKWLTTTKLVMSQALGV